jgi:hypothetical protein
VPTLVDQRESISSSWLARPRMAVAAVSVLPRITISLADDLIAAHRVQHRHPLRVGENSAVLDMLSKRRLHLGFQRGLARREFAAFRDPLASRPSVAIRGREPVSVFLLSWVPVSLGR